jgi:hypothetical protein
MNNKNIISIKFDLNWPTIFPYKSFTIQAPGQVNSWFYENRDEEDFAKKFPNF